MSAITMPARVGERGVLTTRIPRTLGPTLAHRTKGCPHVFSLVARPVGGAEIVANPAASQVVNHEWTRLRNKHVWDEDNPRD